MRRRTKLTTIITLGVTAILATAGCSTVVRDDASSSGSGKGTIKFVSVEGSDDIVAPTMLWEAVLEKQGYDVQVDNVGSLGVLYSAVANGESDVFMSSWLPVTQGSYYDQFSSKLEKLGSWNDEAKLQMAVNADAPIDSLDELAAHASDFDNKIIGVEAGAGLTTLVQNKLIPAYGLDGMQFVTSSTPAMLGQLKSNIQAKKNIVVTLWQPQWAYGAYKLKNLKDPQGILGSNEDLTALSRAGFSAEQPEVANWLKNFKMDTDKLTSLQAALFVDDDTTQYPARLADWMTANTDYVNSLTS